MQLLVNRFRSAPRTLKSRPLFVSVAFAALLAGCSGGQRAADVDEGRARDALKTALDGWKKGDAFDTLKDASPPITVQDFDWMGGAKLVDYHVAGDGRKAESNLYVPVDLTLRTKQGREVKKKVSYVVATSPSLMVFRDVRPR
jgi:hypothetical protein